MDPAEGEQAPINCRLLNLLRTHLKQLEPELLHPRLNDVLIEQGEVADSLLVVKQGRLAIEIHQKGNASRTIAKLGKGAVLGEMALFGIGKVRHSARVRVIDATTEILRFSRQALQSSILFDAELAAEMLLISSERCRNSNLMINQLVDGIDAAACGDDAALADICNSLRNGPDSMVEAADQLEQLLTSAAQRRPER